MPGLLFCFSSLIVFTISSTEMGSSEDNFGSELVQEALIESKRHQLQKDSILLFPNIGKLNEIQICGLF